MRLLFLSAMFPMFWCHIIIEAKTLGNLMEAENHHHHLSQTMNFYSTPHQAHWAFYKYSVSPLSMWLLAFQYVFGTYSDLPHNRGAQIKVILGHSFHLCSRWTTWRPAINKMWITNIRHIRVYILWSIDKTELLGWFSTHRLVSKSD